MEKKVNEVDKNNGKIAKKHSYLKKKATKRTKNQVNFEKKNKKSKTQLNSENRVKMNK